MSFIKMNYNSKFEIILEKCILFTMCLYIYIIFLIGLYVNLEYLLYNNNQSYFNKNEILYYDVFNL